MSHTKNSRTRKRTNLKKRAVALKSKQVVHCIDGSRRTTGQTFELLSLRSVVLDELGYAKDMFLMPLKTVKDALAAGLRRNALEIKKYGRGFAKHNC